MMSNSLKERKSWNARGWIIVLGAGVVFLLWSGLAKGLGILLPDITNDLTHYTWVTGEIAAAMTGFRSVSGVLARPIGTSLGCRLVAMALGTMGACGIIAASFAPTAVSLAVCLIFVTSVGFGILLVLTKAMIGKCFQTHFALPISVASIGDSMALFTMAPLVKLLQDIYGWRGTLLIYGGLCLHLIAVGALLVEPPDHSQPHHYSMIRDDPVEPQQTSSKTSSFKTLMQMLNCSILTKFVFWVLCLVLTSTHLVSIAWYVYFVPHTAAKGFSPEDSISFIAAAGVAQILLKIVIGKLIDEQRITNRACIVISITLCSLALSLDPIINTYWAMTIAAIVLGGFFGLVFCLIDVLAKDVDGIDGLASTYGYSEFFSGISRMTLGFLPGWIFDETGSYDIAFVLIGVGYSVVLIPVVIEWIIHRRSVVPQ